MAVLADEVNSYISLSQWKRSALSSKLLAPNSFLDTVHGIIISCLQDSSLDPERWGNHNSHDKHELFKWFQMKSLLLSRRLLLT